MISWHKPGQKVACIDDTPVPNPLFDRLVKDSVCTIATVHVPPNPLYAHHIGFRLEEPKHPGFYPHRLFRPVYPAAIEELRSRCVPDEALEKERQLLDLNHYLKTL